MKLSEFKCQKLFQKAYESRYTWPDYFNGYRGKCIFIDNNKSFEGDFIINNNFKIEVKNIMDDEIVKNISSQLFEVSIHRVKRNFSDIHQENNFEFLAESKDGIEIKVSGKNEGDKYKVKENKINMVYRHIHGVIIEIFVEDFLDTGNGFLSKKYTSQQLDINKKTPKSKPLEYIDNYINLDKNKLWVLESRLIKYLGKDGQKMSKKFYFKEISVI